MPEETDLPRWDLTNVYPAIGSDEYEEAKSKLSRLVADLGIFFQAGGINPEPLSINWDRENLISLVSESVTRIAEVRELGYTLGAFLRSFITTDSYNEIARKEYSLLEPVFERVNQLENVHFMGWVGRIGDQIEAILEGDPVIAEHAFYLRELIAQSQYLMSPAEEELAGELFLSGATAWNKLQGHITSQLKWPVEDETGQTTELPMTAIINLRGNQDESIRRRGYQAELAAWKSVETPLAAAMNGVKGSQYTILKRRGRPDPVHKSLDQSKIDRETLEVMLSAMRESFPMFRRYFNAKAKRLGKEKLAWWDLFAPTGKTSREISYRQAQQIVRENFAKFSEELAEFANTAFQKNWIDVSPRPGKRAGAFCMRVPGVNQSRILLNFEGNLDWVFTLAHELGHGFHNHCLFQAGRTSLQTRNPMTLAETASIMCETIVTNAALKLAADDQEELAILETALLGDSQVIVDIYSRYLFEAEVFERRAKAELSAEEFNEIMIWAQGETYGESLDPEFRQPYMWTWKPHYYYPGLAFYNYPYAFGLLFGTGLFTIYQQRGEDFVTEYKDLLASTGMGTAVDLAARFDIDLHEKAFWEGSLKLIGERVARYEQL